jgi:hypothetical protein
MEHTVSGKMVAGIAAVLLAIVTCCVGGLALGGAGLALAGCADVPSSRTANPGSAPTAPIGGWPNLGRWNPSQVANVATIVTVGQQLHVPARGWVIAVATAIQESALTNMDNLGAPNDHDSLGLFQQRPSQGWGTPAQTMNPVYASTQFYQRLQQVPNWQNLPLTQAAQSVQRSAYPDAYAKHESQATMLVETLGSESWRAHPEMLEQCPSNCPQILSSAGGDGLSKAGLPPPTGVPSPTPECAAGAAVLGRAATWLTAWGGGPVPYLSSSDPGTWLDGYRRDCSGYASMALGLPGPGLDSAALAAASAPIARSALRAGDLLINPAPGAAGHVVIFDHWANTAMTSYLGYEQSSDGGTHHRAISYPYFGGYSMSPYRL